jgi:hypothetical protein
MFWKAGQIEGIFEKTLTEHGFQMKVAYDDQELSEYYARNHMRMVAFVTYFDGEVRFPGTRTVTVEDSKMVYTFPDLKRDIEPMSLYVHTLPIDSNTPHPDYRRMSFMIPGAGQRQLPQ